MILITGGAGYIGSHLALRLLRENYDVIIYDNLYNSTMFNLNTIVKRVKRQSRFYFARGDIRDSDKLERLFRKYAITKVIHLAGLKSVSDSFEEQTLYNSVNVIGSEIVLKMAVKYDVQTILFSSTASVYHPLPVGRYDETMAVTDTGSYYSRTKFETEKLLATLKQKDITIDVVILRYFNPVGTDVSGLLVEERIRVNNLFPAILQSIKNDTYLEIYGDDYLTFDGTAIRDYIHINDLVDAHLLMLKDKVLSTDMRVFNVGSDTGYSVREVVDEFNRQLNQPVKYVYRPRRQGDVMSCIADIDKIKKTFNWKPKYKLEDMVQSTLTCDDMNLL